MHSVGRRLFDIGPSSEMVDSWRIAYGLASVAGCGHLTNVCILSRSDQLLDELAKGGGMKREMRVRRGRMGFGRSRGAGIEWTLEHTDGGAGRQRGKELYTTPISTSTLHTNHIFDCSEAFRVAA